jgi:pyridoxal biosynthesis lyase PdxS
MTTKKKQNSKVPKSAKTRFSDLTPKNDARAGQLPVVNPGASGIATPSASASSLAKKHLIKLPPPSA